ncbi:MAG: hypothetical protein ACI8Q1_001327 [Parvicella sp.]|jgi:hypothetical protein
MTQFKQIILLAIMAFTTLNVSAQFDPVKFKESIATASFREKLEAANLLMEDKLFTYAADVLVELAKEQPDNANVNYKAGFCLLQLSNRRSEALPYLISAEKGISKKYNPFNVMETAAPFETHYYLGKAYHLNEKIDLAETNYQAFLDDISKKHILFDATELELKHCIVARQELANPTPYIIENLGTKVNGSYDDYSPVITPDESVLFLTSRRVRPDSSNAKIFSPQDGMHFEDIYVSYKNFKTGEWGEPTVLDKVCSPNSNQATISVSGDGQQLFLYKDIDGDGQIHHATYNSETQTYDNVIKLGPGSDINTEYWETHVTISADGKELYFVSDRPGGLGGRDIYISRMLPNGQWSMAQNLGAPINTPNDEDSPYFHPDGKTLFFSSNGEKSVGGFDIFVTLKDEDDQWKEPTNMGYPLNSMDDDVFFMTNASGKTGYFSGLHKDDTYGEKDNYMLKLNNSPIVDYAILKGYIDPGPGKTLPEGITIYVTNLTEGGDPVLFRPNTKNGSYIFNLKPCNEFLVEYLLNDEMFYETEFAVPCEAGYTENDIVLSLDGILLNGEADTTSIPADVDKTEWKYQLLVGDKPYLDQGFIEFMDGDLVAYKEFADADGYFKYRDLDGTKQSLKLIDIDDPSLCDQMKLRLYDENGVLVKETTRDVRCKSSTITFEPAKYEKFYGYNIKGIKSDAERWETFLNEIVVIVEKTGQVKIELIGSASKVPTRTFKNNENLAENRTSDAIAQLKEDLKKKGIDESKIKVIAIQSKVQGPTYVGDFKNTEKYGPHQYVKFIAN